MKFSDNASKFLRPLMRPVNRKYAIFGAAIFTLVMFGDMLIPWIGHGIHLAIEVLELSFEHLLESAFGLSRRAAQAMTAWTGLILGVYVLVRLLRRAWTATRQAWVTAVESCQRLITFGQSGMTVPPWAKLTLVAGAVGATLLVLS